MTEPTPNLNPDIDTQRLLFIAGLHRSGTSLIHRCIADHPQVSGFLGTGAPEDEGQHLQSVMRTAAEYGGPGVFGFDSASHLDDRSPSVSPDSAQRILNQWSVHWDLERRILVEKSPPNLVRTRFLQALFPGCKFLVVLRHPVAVSLATRKWTTYLPMLRKLGVPDRRLPHISVHRLMRHWLVCHERFERDLPYLDNVHVIRYEDFVDNPEQELGSIFDYLELENAPLTQTIRSNVNDRYWDIWEARRSSAPTRWYDRRLVRRMESSMNRFGYSLTNRAADAAPL